MEVEVLEKYRKAGRILSEVRKLAIDTIKPDVKLLDVANEVEDGIRRLGGEPAFPVNISRNEDAAHYAPSPRDESVFADDIVKIDLGVHIDGYIADSAFSVDLRGEPELVEASRAAVEAAIAMVRPGVTPGELGTVIEKTIEDFGYHPIYNLTGHGLQQWIQHAQPTIPNYAVKGGVGLETDQVIAIEPFATDGVGKVGESGIVEIYSLHSSRPVRQATARELIKQISKYRTLPFARRWLDVPKRDFTLKQLVRKGILRDYGVLREQSGGLVSQHEHTLIVTDDGCEVMTR